MRLYSLLLLALVTRASHAQAPAPASSARATVSGFVRDSVARTPLDGATVQLVAADGQARAARSATADSLGRYRIDSVPDGRYMLGFFHPMLDSLGLEPTVRELTVAGGTSLRADLATPAPAQIRAAICGPASAADSSAVLVGTVRDARDGAAMAGATVSGEWMEYTFTTGGIKRRMPRLVASTSENGWFALCNVPRAGTVALLASKGADSTDLLDVQMPAEGFLRRELYLGSAQTTMVRPAPARADTTAPSPRRVRRGIGQVSGSVVAAVGHKPLAGASVGLVDGPQTRVGENGEFTLTDAPLGTRVLEIRAVGYYPERRKVDVVAGAPPVRIALSTLRAMLDTVRVTAARVRGIDFAGFLDRKNGGAGKFLTAEDIARRGAFTTSDIFRSVSGLSLDLGGDGFRRFITMRGVFADRCSPAIYFNGSYVGGLASDGGGLDVDDLNAFVKPEEVAGIEVYMQGTVPPQFQQGMSDCGSIVIWSK